MIIQLKNIVHRFGYHDIFRSLNFSMEKGEFIYLVGNTGTGKTTLLRLIYHQIIPDEGEVEVLGNSLKKLSERKISRLRRRIGIVFQDFSLFKDRNVFDNISFPMEIAGVRYFIIRRKVNKLLEKLDLRSHKRHTLSMLSGGELQRVCIARSLANNPELLIIDEPTGHLDPTAAIDIMTFLQEISHNGVSILMVTHNYQLIEQFPNRTLSLQNGILTPANSI